MKNNVYYHRFVIIIFIIFLVNVILYFGYTISRTDDAKSYCNTTKNQIISILNCYIKDEIYSYDLMEIKEGLERFNIPNHKEVIDNYTALSVVVTMIEELESNKNDSNSEEIKMQYTAIMEYLKNKENL